MSGSRETRSCLGCGSPVYRWIISDGSCRYQFCNSQCSNKYKKLKSSRKQTRKSIRKKSKRKRFKRRIKVLERRFGTDIDREFLQWENELEKKKKCGQRGKTFPHREAYKKNKGSIPRGHHIHHIDGDHHNNSVDNLVAVSSYTHWWIHRKYSKERLPSKREIACISENLKDKDKPIILIKKGGGNGKGERLKAGISSSGGERSG
jgi:hypothetical protein